MNKETTIEDLRRDLADIDKQISQYATARPSAAAMGEITRLSEARQRVLDRITEIEA